MNAEDTENLVSRNSPVLTFVEKVGGNVPVNNRRLRLVWDRDQDVPPGGAHCSQFDEDVGHTSGSSATWWRHAGDNQATTLVSIERSSDVEGRKAGKDVTCPLLEWLISLTSTMA